MYWYINMTTKAANPTMTYRNWHQRFETNPEISKWMPTSRTKHKRFQTNNDPWGNPYTLQTPPNLYPYLQNTPTRTKGKGIQGYGSGSLWGHSGVTCAHHYVYVQFRIFDFEINLSICNYLPYSVFTPLYVRKSRNPLQRAVTWCNTNQTGYENCRSSCIQAKALFALMGLLCCHLAFQWVPTLQITIYTQYKGHREHIVWVNNPATNPCLAEKSQKIANHTILRKGGFGCGSGHMFVTNWTNGNGIGTAIVTENR